MNYEEFARRASHAEILISQGKYPQAEDILSGLMATGVDRQDIWRMLIMTWIGMGEYNAAKDLCKTSLHHYPHDAWTLYSLAHIYWAESQYQEAQNYLQEAIKMEPDSDNYHTLLSSIHLSQKNYTKALDCTNTALELNPENVEALNNRAQALLALGRKEEAFVGMEFALRTDPENPETHAHMGWHLLHIGQEKKALYHFKEALQKNPLNDYALNGMQEAMKAQFPLYRYFLMLSLKLQKLNNQQQWGFIIGVYLIYRGLIYIAKQFESLQLFIFPILFLLIFYFISSWILSPLMNLYLLTNIFGKLTLTDGQKESAKYTGIALTLCLISVGIYYMDATNEGWLHLALVAFLLMIPLGSMNNSLEILTTKKLRFFTLALTILGLGSALVALLDGDFLNVTIWPFIIGTFAYQWYANYLLMTEE